MSPSVRRRAVLGAVGVLAFGGLVFAIATGREPARVKTPENARITVSDVAAGGELYRARCAACHQSAGLGGALSYAENAPSFKGTHPLEIATAVRGGLGEMPPFSPAQMSDAELEQVVTYVQFLQDPGAPGGAPITSVGPVSEGAVAWLVGVGALVLAIRWIGRRDE